jgi:drug/metabolite transporter (DMT)-like permease
MKNRTMHPYISLGILALIWGSSFILMKEGLKIFSSYQVAAMRISFAGLALLPFVNWKKVQLKKGDLKYFAISGFTGSAIPAFLFTAAQTKISSSLAGALNGLTPLFALLVGVIFLKVEFNKKKFLGVIFGLVGALFLVYRQDINYNIGYTLLVVLATLLYGINVNIIKHKLSDYPPLLVSALPLAIIGLFGGIVLLYTGLHIELAESQNVRSLLAVIILAIVGTAFSLILFNKLIHQTNAVFATSVTYLIPIVALYWGFLANEVISLNQIGGLLFIIIAIWMIRNDKT